MAGNNQENNRPEQPSTGAGTEAPPVDSSDSAASATNAPLDDTGKYLTISRLATLEYMNRRANSCLLI